MIREKNEEALVAEIARTFGPAQAKALLVALGDDAALWATSSGYQTILTCDWFLEGSHFLRHKHSPDAVGWKCLARAVSDIAAMGGHPRCFLLSLALPSGLTGQWLSSFLRGLRRASGELRCELAGGDITRQEKVLISVTVLGEVQRRRAILRSGARPGDVVFVSGTLGEADLGLRQLAGHRGISKATSVVLRKHLYPQPRLALGQWLAKNRLATAMMDISDGLSIDLARLCAASRVGALIEPDALPVTRFTTEPDARQLALHGGDDYELLFTMPAQKANRLPSSYEGLRLTRIGKITRAKKILVRTAVDKFQPLKPGGWDPFRPASLRIY